MSATSNGSSAFRIATDLAGPVARAVDAMIADAVARRASDVHLDPVAGATRVRLRVDGYFEEGLLPSVPHDRLVARIKVLAELAPHRREDVQEGAVRLDPHVDLRVSVLPTAAGEKVTLRIFDRRCRPFHLEEAGFTPRAAARLESLTDRRAGAIVVAGPSGCGKTTTLYAFVHRILTTRGAWTNVCSVEDPVEFAIDGAHQVEVRRERGLGFPAALAALLRQDPEVLLVGEIRDAETASIAIEAGLTGHLVLTSTHAASAVAAVHRLLDLGVEPYLLATALEAVIGQRLVRRNCPDCAVADEPSSELRGRLKAGDGDWRRGKGCTGCRGTGYRGRIPLCEVLEIHRGIAARLLARADDCDGTELLSDRRSLLDDGVERARLGETTLDEIARVVDAPGRRA